LSWEGRNQSNGSWGEADGTFASHNFWFEGIWQNKRYFPPAFLLHSDPCSKSLPYSPTAPWQDYKSSSSWAKLIYGYSSSSYIYSSGGALSRRSSVLK